MWLSNFVSFVPFAAFKGCRFTCDRSGIPMCPWSSFFLHIISSALRLHAGHFDWVPLVGLVRELFLCVSLFLCFVFFPICLHIFSCHWGCMQVVLIWLLDFTFKVHFRWKCTTSIVCMQVILIVVAFIGWGSAAAQVRGKVLLPPPHRVITENQRFAQKILLFNL